MSDRLSPLRLVYLGNLGLAHDVPLLVNFLVACASQTSVEVAFVGTNKSAVDAVQTSVGRDRITVTSEPRVIFDHLGAVLRPRDFHYGLVTLSERFAGLLSPSKFSGYLVAGLPLVYLGPAATNAAIVCDQLGAGVRIADAELRDGLRKERVVDPVLSRAHWEKCSTCVPSAIAHFDRFDAGYLADEILARITVAS